MLGQGSFGKVFLVRKVQASIFQKFTGQVKRLNNNLKLHLNIWNHLLLGQASVFLSKVSLVKSIALITWKNSTSTFEPISATRARTLERCMPWKFWRRQRWRYWNEQMKIKSSLCEKVQVVLEKVRDRVRMKLERNIERNIKIYWEILRNFEKY